MKPHWFELEDKVFDCQQWVVRLIDLAVQRGADRDGLLRGTGIFYQDLQLAHSQAQSTVPIPTRLSSAKLLKLIQNANKLVKSQDLGFMLGRRLFPANLGAFSSPVNDAGLLLSNSRHLNDMLRLASVMQRQLFPFIWCRAERTASHTHLIMNPAIARHEQEAFFLELLCSAIHSACKWQFGQTIPMQFHFSFPRPRNIYQYEENLGHRLHFDAPLAMLVIENHWLTQPLPDSSPMVRQQQRYLFTQTRKAVGTGNQANHQTGEFLPPGLLQFVSEHLRKCPHSSLEEVAQTMQISPATLKRKLRQHGTHFQSLQDALRQQQAVFDLNVRGDTTKVIAERLGFTDLTNFRRAFKRWTGKTPSQMRGT